MVSQIRRVSFDLEHNTVHILPTSKQVKEHADQLRREAYENRTLRDELLDESIVTEIVTACRFSARASPSALPKGCLKTPPPPPSPASAPPSSHKRKNKKSRKRRSTHRPMSGAISVH
ncbi:hypothetical protein BC940DRAFT_330213 [Gongronella butleri]|nr:hypothetical protein BC940DRAFT_330213 [Gongronella butleri]